MNILLTGGAGYIGSHTAIALLKAGYKVIIADNLSNSKYEMITTIMQITKKEVLFYEIDIADSQALEVIFEKHEINAILHFAGLKVVGESVEKPLDYYYANLLSTMILIKTSLKYNVKKFVFSSTAAVYGDSKKMPVTESMNLLPTTSPYAETKAMIERMLTDITNVNPNFSVAILRYFNPVGAHESGLIGEVSNSVPNNVMPYICQVANGKLKKLKVFGNDYSTVDGTGVRDYIHVSDLAEGHVSALNHLREGVHIYNLGTGKGTSVLELVQAFEEANGIKIPFEIVERRPGDIAESYADVSKAERELAWRAKRNIIDMSKDAWRFEKGQAKGVKL